MHHITRSLIGLAGALVLPLATAKAQDAPQPLCRGVQEPGRDDVARLLLIDCGGAAAMLGQADAVDIENLPDLASAVVVASLGGTRRAWLVMREGERSLTVEEITGTIARAAGRGASARLDRLQLGYPGGEDGQTRRNVMSVRLPGAQPMQGEVDLARLVERSRAVRAAAPTTDQR